MIDFNSADPLSDPDWYPLVREKYEIPMQMQMMKTFEKTITIEPRPWRTVNLTEFLAIKTIADLAEEQKLVELSMTSV